MEPETSHKSAIIIATIAILGAGGVGYAGYWGYGKFTALENSKIALEQELAKTKQEYASTTQKLQSDIEEAKAYVVLTQTARVNAEQDVQKQQDALDALSKTLGLYEKLTQTDRELLTKYSKDLMLFCDMIDSILIQILTTTI